MNYDALIDAETRAFIRTTQEAYPEDAADLSIAGQRRAYDDMCRLFYAGRPDGVDVQDILAGTVPVRVYTAGQPSRTVLYFHGGGFVLGGLDSHDDICAEICAETGYRVVSVDYRLAPEHRHPAAFDDAWAAAQWAANEFGDGLVLAGDSAGGNLAAALAQYGRGRLDGILGQVLIYPDLGGDMTRGSYADHADAPLLTRDEVGFYRQARHQGPVPEDDPTCLPLADGDFTNLPPTVVFTADCDPVRDDGRDYCERLDGAGSRAFWINEDGLVHGYLRARRTVARARDSFERITIAVEALGQGMWPYG